MKKLLFKGKWKLLAYNFRLKKKLTYLSCARGLGSQKNSAWTFWCCVKEQIGEVPGDGLRKDIAVFSPHVSGIWWQWQMATPKQFTKGFFKTSQTAPIWFGCLLSFLHEKEEIFGKKRLQNAAKRELPRVSVSLGSCSIHQGKHFNSAWRAPFLCKQHLP